ncbi:hypothetical protein SS50377_22496 [Spironucleus salmonicida]|uniref:Uncharacterized protein n=1 Tax=Spironucleus salmonicida TaxID=348837 RepID=V6LCN1_9EUKA|nr:hypothetical protein SS50377_22496 [Spironucleus salmonicida]|eukprot:EST42013.1 hypothetical protein SS50377_18319 [Spironucleus salmonicida]
MQLQIQQALEQSLNPLTIQQATQTLETMRLDPNFTENLIPFLQTDLALPAIIQLSLTHKNFIDRQPQPYLKLAIQLLQIPPQISAIPKTSNFLNQLVPHLFESGWFTQINDLQEMFVQQQNILALNAVCACFEKFQSVSLNDEIATKILNLLENSKEMVNFVFKDYTQQYSSILRLLRAAFSWEDLPDFYLEHYQDIITLLYKIINNNMCNKEEFEVINEIVGEAICVHSEELKEHLEISVQFLIYCVEMHVLDCNYEYFVAKTLNKLAHFISSPEMQQIMLKFTSSLYQLTLKALQITEQDYDNIKFCDNLYFQCYQSRYDFNSRKDGAEQILKELSKLIPEMKQNIQQQAFQQVTFDNLSIQIILFRVFSIQSMSKILGIKLQVDQDYVNQFGRNLYNLIQSISSVSDEKISLIFSDILKFTVDFQTVLEDSILTELIQKLVAIYLGNSNQFYNKNMASSVTQALTSKVPCSQFINEKILSKLIIESQENVMSDIEIQAVYCILKAVVNSLSIESQSQFMQQILQLLQISLQNEAGQSYLHYLFETTGIFIKFAKFDVQDIFIYLQQLTLNVNESQLQEISPFIYQLFTLTSNTDIQLPLLYQSLTIETYQNYPDMTLPLLFFADKYLTNNKIEFYQKPNTILRLTQEFGPQLKIEPVIQDLITILVQQKSKMHLAIKFINNTMATIRYEQQFLSQLTMFIMSQKQILFTNRELLKQCSIYLLMEIENIPNQQETLQMIIKPAATSFGIRDQYKQIYCSLLVEKSSSLSQFLPLIIEICGLALGKIRTRGNMGLTRQEKEGQVVGVSVLDSVLDKENVLSLADLTAECQQRLGVTAWQ